VVNPDGHELCRRIRSGVEPGITGALSEIPVVVVTAEDTYDERDRWFESGAADFIPKPFKADELVDAINKALPVAGGGFSDLRVLIVEDSSILRRMIAQLVSCMGPKVTAKENGREALNELKNSPQPYDLLLTDFAMPDMNGLELCQEVRKKWSSDNLPIVFLSAFTERETILNAFSVGATDYLAKPFFKEELVARLQVYFSRQVSQNKLKDMIRRMEEIAKITAQ